MAVYFAAAGPYVKIGLSADPLVRVGTITTAGKRPTDLPRAANATLLGWVPGDWLTEAGYHSQFAADHVAGEWFYLDADMVRDIIWAHPAGVDIHRMSAFAVLAADKYPGVTRAEVAALGIPIESRPVEEVVSAAFKFLGGVA